MDTQLRDEHYVKLMRDFDVYGMALYIGQGITPEELSDSFCRLPWGCIITSHRDLSFDRIFQEAGKRNVTTCTKREEVTGRVFQSNKFYVTHLYADVDASSEMYEEVDLADNEVKFSLRNKRALNIFEYMLDRIRAEHGKLVIIGYDENDEQEFPVVDFYLRLVEKNDEVLFFQSIVNDYRLLNIVKKRNAWFDESIVEVVSTHEEDDHLDGNEQYPWEEKHVFFKAKKHVSIENSFLEKSSYFLQLLTEQTVRRFIPYGKKLQELWFFNFLHNSSKEPQWYGYLSQTEFYLKRNFEDTLVAVVKGLLLSNLRHGKKGEDTSVILEGAPGSSKSIELCALAYRIYNEELNPVIYIKNDSLSFSSGSDEFELLDELMTKIEQNGDNDMRILILWDSASYRNVTREADNLALELSNRGRRFVLVCTAYEKSGNKQDASCSGAGWYRCTKEGTLCPISLEETEARNGRDVYFDGKHYFISATRTMEAGEKAKLKEKVRRFILQDKDAFERKWESIEYDVRHSGGGEDSVNDIFYCFYSLIRTLQPQLDRGLTREQEYIARYVKTQLNIIVGKRPSVEPVMSDMMIALKEAGIELTDEDYQLMNSGEEDLDEKYDLDKFNICIALFSRFKLRTPYGLAYFMFWKDKTIERTVYDSSHRELMDVLMNDFSYIVYSKDDQSYFFRNSLEAVLFLRNNNISEEDQINIVCEMLDYYARTWNMDTFVDPVLAHELPKLLRMIGPNTDYGPFWRDGSQNDVHQRLLKHLEKIIQKLQYMRLELMVPDSEGTFAHLEITFTREFYGKNWNKICGDSFNAELYREKDLEDALHQSYRNRLLKLRGAVSLAKETTKKLETLLQMELATYRTTKSHRFFLHGQMNSMRVERALCDANFNIVKNEYLDLCRQYGVSPDPEIECLQGDAYLGLYQSLYEAICSDPMNAYAYNALFQVFEEEYQKCRVAKNQEAMMQRLSEVRLIADEAASLEIQNRSGNYELGQHLATIASYSREQRVCIADITEGDPTHPFVKLFQSMLAKNNASAICFVCQQELDGVGLGVKDLLEHPFRISEAQRRVCLCIMDFMKQEEYKECVEHDPYALYFLLRVSWMYYNCSLLEDGREAKNTRLNRAAWQDIHHICEHYHLCVRDKERRGLRPIVELLRALAKIHLFGNYVDAEGIMRDLEEFSVFSYRRMRVPYLVCDEHGIPKRYTGKVVSLDHDNQFKGYIHFDGVKIRRGVRFTKTNLGMRMRPVENVVLSDLELGLGYAGFSAYRQEGREGDSER